MTTVSEDDRSEVLKVADFRNLWLANGFRDASGEIAGFALPITAVVLLGASPVQMAFIAMCANIGYLLFGLPAGVWVDRMPKRTVLSAAETAYVLALASIPIAYLADSLTVVQLMLVAVILSIAGVFFGIAHLSVLPLILPKKRVSDAKARLTTSSTSISVIAPAAAGAAAQSIAAPVLYGVAAACQLVSAVLVRRIHPVEPSPPEQVRRNFRAEIADGVRIVFRQPLLRLLLGQTAVNNLGAGIMIAVMAYFLLDTLAIEPWLFGALSAVGAVSGFVASLVCPWLRRRFGEIRMTMLFSGLAPVAMLFLPLAGVLRDQAIVLIAIGQILLGTALVGRSVAVAGLRARVTPNRYLSRVTAAAAVVTQGATPLGTVAGGLLAGVWSAPTALWVGVAVMTVPIVMLLRSPLRAHPTLPPEWEIDD
ncbi:MFS transporter [Nocardia sp. NPDC059180]|uniref:MFS transporter n=1 Tax=Nocardia sp. NPDC059180 TaxID=3346761 RepID=UPI0036A65FC9